MKLSTALFVLSLILLAVIPPVHAKEYNLLLADHTQGKLFIRSSDGRIVWQHPSPSLYEAWAQSDGSIVYSTGLTVEKIIPDLVTGVGGTSIWTYKFGTDESIAPVPKGIIYTCTPLSNGNILVTESGTFRLVEINNKGKIVHCIKLPPAKAELGDSIRLTRYTPQNTYLVPYFGEGRFKEFDQSGKQISEIDMGQYFETPANSAYEAVPLKDGRLLISCGPKNQIIILDKNGKADWKLTVDDVPKHMIFNWLTKVIPLENGNIIVCNYCKGKAEVKAFEINPAKEIVWQLRDPRIGGLTTLQLLTKGYRPLLSGQ